MSENLVRCIRCEGRGQMYKLGNGYTHTNMGGELVTCPLCMGKKKIEPLSVVVNETESEKDDGEKEPEPKKGCKKGCKKGIKKGSPKKTERKAK